MANVLRPTALSPSIGSHIFQHIIISIVRPIWHIGLAVSTMIDLLYESARARHECHLDEGGRSIKADALWCVWSKQNTNELEMVCSFPERKELEKVRADDDDGDGDGGKRETTQ